ncbi:MAG: hypothetical protein EBU80_10205, partial [Chitinophagia bacterium]|nr:hypothetical protein [Chitinophagia bacterium]
GSASGNYTLTQPTLSANITAKALTITNAIANNKVYDGTNIATITGTLSGIVSNENVMLLGTGTFAQINVGTGIDVTSTSTLNGSDVGNYTLVQPTNLKADITPGAAAKLSFGQQPSSAQAGSSLGSVTVLIQDAYGNTVTSSSSPVTIAISNNAGSGTLTGTQTVNAQSGIATFNSLAINKVGTGYTLTATSSSLTSTISSAFNITVGVASKLLLEDGNNQSATVNTAVSTLPSVIVKDEYDNVVSGVSVTFAVTGGGGSITGASATTNASGIATLGSWTLGTTAGTNTLTATSGSLTGSPVTFTATGTAGAATSFKITGSTTQTAGSSQTITITAQDQYGNTATSYSGSKNITFTGANASTNPSTAPKVESINFGSSTSLTFTNGVATASMQLYKAETATVQATDGTVSSSGTDNLEVLVSAASSAKLIFKQQPVNTVAGANISPAVTAEIQDTYGNKTSGTNQVSIYISTNPSSGTLSGTTSVNAVAGLVTFSGLSIDKSGSNYVLTISSSGLTSANSNSFDIIVGAASKLRIRQQAAGAKSGIIFNTQPIIELLDDNNNLITNDDHLITMTVSSGTAYGTYTVTSASGVATFTNAGVNAQGGTTVTLTFSASGLTEVKHDIFVVNQAPSGANKSNITAHQNETLLITDSDFGFSDPDNNNFYSVIITSLPTKGKLQLKDGSTWTDVVLNQEILSSAIMSPAQGLRFVPVNNDNAVTNYSSFSYMVKDNGGVVNSGINQSVNSYTLSFDLIDSRSPNQTVPGEQTMNEDTQLTFSSSNANLISISYGGAGNLKTTLHVGKGTLSVSNIPQSLSVTGNNTTDLVLEGSVSDINSTINGLVFQPLANDTGHTYTVLTIKSVNVPANGGFLYPEDINTIDIVVNNVNDTPTALQLSQLSVDENNSIGGTIGTLSSSDPDIDTHTYTLVSGAGGEDNAKFKISGSILEANAVFDYETKGSYNILVRTTDAGGLSYTRTFTISINDRLEKPNGLTYVSTSSVYGTGGSMTPSLSFNGGTATVTYSILNSQIPSGVTIDQQSGVISYVSTVSAGTYTLSIRVVNSFGSTDFDASLSITPKSLTITAEDKSKVYGEVNPTFTVSY